MADKTDGIVLDYAAVLKLLDAIEQVLMQIRPGLRGEPEPRLRVVAGTAKRRTKRKAKLTPVDG